MEALGEHHYYCYSCLATAGRMREYGIVQVYKRKVLISLFVKYWDNNPNTLLSFTRIGATQL